MFVEKRKNGKLYLVHSYRDKSNKVRKIRKYLGRNLSRSEIRVKTKEAKESIKEQISKLKTDIFDFTLTEKEIESLNKYNDKISIFHLDKKDWQQFTEDFVYNTNAIEGSNVLRKEVPEILSKNKTENNEELETKGVAKAVEFIRKTKQELSLKLILHIHKLCFESSKPFAGKLRDVEVVIRDSHGHIVHSGAPVKHMRKELNRLFEWYQSNKNKFKPLPLAAIIHNQFEEIHPFQDGNGRVGRLLLNFILLRNKYLPINILLEDRAEYYHTLYEYQHNNKIRPTLKFLIKQYKKTLKRVTTKRK